MRDLLELLKEIKTSPGGVIRAHRKNFRITLKELSKATGIAESNLSLIENDKVEIGIKRATLVGAALGVDPAFIIFPSGYEPYKTEAEQVRKTARRLFLKKIAA